LIKLKTQIAKAFNFRGLKRITNKNFNFVNSIEKIIFFLSFNSEGKYPKAISNKLASLHVFLLAFLLLFVGFSYFYNINESGLITTFTLLSSLVTILDWIYVYKTKNVNIASGIFLLVILGQYSLNFFLFFDRLFILFFVFSIPIITLFLFGIRKNIVINLAVFFVTLFFYSYSDVLSESSYLEFKINSISLFVFISVLTTVLFFIAKFYHSQLVNKLKESDKIIQEKNGFSTSLTYQIRTPLSNIHGALDFIQKKGLTDKQLDLLHTIKASTNNLMSVLDNISNIQNFKINLQGYEEQKFDIKETLNNTFGLYTHNKTKPLTLNTQFIENLPALVLGQPVKLKQIILNIIEFFIRFYPKEKPSIVLNFLLSISKEMEDKVVLSFEFKSETPLHLDIENFNSKNKLRGEEDVDYLITRSLIESSKGSMNVLSNPFETTFSFTLEYEKSEIQKVQIDDLNDQIQVATAYKSKKIEHLCDSVVLIVEDNLINQKIMVLSLKKLVHEIVIANNGQEALDAMKINNFHIVLMDIQMPVMDGLEASMRIRKNEKDDDRIPIIAITANALHGDRESCLSAGMNDYISKPFKLEVLLEKMKYHLNVQD